jgi:hypothetical protein
VRRKPPGFASTWGSQFPTPAGPLRGIQHLAALCSVMSHQLALGAFLTTEHCALGTLLSCAAPTELDSHPAGHPFDSLPPAQYSPLVIRLPLIFAAALVLAQPLAAEPQVNPPPAEPPPPPVAQPTGRSLVAIAQDPRAMEGYDENPAVTRRMVDALVRTVTGAASTRDAWRELAGTDTRVGIKVTAAGGPYFATRRGVVAAAIAGLKDAGVREVIVWDKSAAALRDSGFTSQRLGCEVRGIELPRGWDREASFQAPVLGKLIWGDLLFAEKLGNRDDNLLSSKSHLATILSKDVPRFINIAALSDAPGCGIAGTLHSAVVDNLDNWRRFTTYGESGSSAIADCYADPRLGGKCVLHILDALAVTYAGGPAPNPQASTIHNSLYASRDPVALDSIGLRLLEKWRQRASFGPIGIKAAWLHGTNVGNSDETMMILTTAR